MKRLRKIVVAPDSFKGSLSSSEVASYVKTGILKVFPDCDVKSLSIADGGEGTVDALVDCLGGEVVEAEVNDPLGMLHKAYYGIVEYGGQKTAVIEMAAASGLPLLDINERNPMETSTFGTGQLVYDAILRGCRKFMIGIGGSATNDGGTGMLSALGFRFLDASGNVLEGKGSSLSSIVSVDDSLVLPEVLESEYLVACDVTAPFFGPEGAAFVFAPQKGADQLMTEALDKGLRSFAGVVYEYSGIDISDMPGAGAAGGLGGGLKAFLGAVLIPGADMVLDAVNFNREVSGSDLVITGEGKIDRQTSMGKAPACVLKRATALNIPVFAIGGCVDVPEELGTMGFAAIFPIVSAPMTSVNAMCPNVAGGNIVRTVSQIMNILKTCLCVLI